VCSTAYATDLKPEEKEASAFHVLTGTLTARTKDEKRTADKKAIADAALAKEAKLRELLAGYKKQLAAEKDPRKKLTLGVQIEDTNADLVEMLDEWKGQLECHDALEFYYGDFTIDTAAQGKADAETDDERKQLELVSLKKGDVVTLAFGEVAKGDCGQNKPVPAGKKIKVWVIPSKTGKLIPLPPNGWEEAK
jgi:hypothetical protein